MGLAARVEACVEFLLRALSGRKKRERERVDGCYGVVSKVAFPLLLLLSPRYFHGVVRAGAARHSFVFPAAGVRMAPSHAGRDYCGTCCSTSGLSPSPSHLHLSGLRLDHRRHSHLIFHPHLSSSPITSSAMLDPCPGHFLGLLTGMLARLLSLSLCLGCRSTATKLRRWGKSARGCPVDATADGARKRRAAYRSPSTMRGTQAAYLSTVSPPLHSPPLSLPQNTTHSRLHPPPRTEVAAKAACRRRSTAKGKATRAGQGCCGWTGACRACFVSGGPPCV